MGKTLINLKRALGFRDVEDCIQCGVPGPHRIVAVMISKDNPQLAIHRDHKFASFPICNACHQQPRLKAHFHDRAVSALAVERAGTGNIG